MILLGIDGATWTLIDPLLRAGRLPHLQSLIDEGVRAPMKSMLPSRSPALWTTVATGKVFEKHGIDDFTTDAGKGGEQVQRVMHMTSNMRRTSALWNILSDAGRRVAFIGWWVTWPAEKINGYMVSSYVPLEQTGGKAKPTKGTLVEGIGRQTWPPELFEELRPLLRFAQTVTYEEAKRFMSIDPVDMNRDIVEGFRWAYAADETYRKSAIHILEKDPDLDLVGIYFNGVDVMEHRYWTYMQPENDPQLPIEEIERFGKAIDEYYVYTDSLIGEILRHRRPGDTILVLSDHGFDAHGHGHGPDGIFIAAGRDVVKKRWIGEVRLVDIAPTVLALLDMKGAQDMDGRVLDDWFPKAWKKAYPKEKVPTYDTGDWQQQDPLGSGVDQELSTRLRALGYLK